MMNLTQRGFCNSFSGASFSARYNKKHLEQTKRQAGPHFARFSTDIAKVNTWVAASYIHTTLRQNLLEKIQFNTSTYHKDCTLWFEMLLNNVKLLK